MSERAMLMRLVEAAENVEPDWQDALRRAGNAGRDVSPRLGRLGRRRLSAAAAVAVVAIAVALLLVSPWQGRSGLVERALAAVGTQPVLHVVITQPPSYDQQLVDLATGQPVRPTVRTKIWFDGSRDLKKTVTIRDGVVVEELLETAQGGFSTSGPVYTCAWIARHPFEATKASVSCNPDMQNATTPDDLVEQRPKLDVALTGFLDHYRSALASGTAVVIGEDEIDGQTVTWLRIKTAAGGSGVDSSQDVGIDSATYKPVLVRSRDGAATTFRVNAITALPYEPALFTRPTRIHRPSISQVAAASPIAPVAASSLIGGRAFWLGEERNGLRLTTTRKEELTTGYGSASGREPVRSTGVAFEYARIADGGTAGDRPVVIIRQSAQCPFAYGWTCTARDPSGTTIRVGSPHGFPSIFRLDGTYIAISDRGSGHDPLELARALTPVPG